MRIFSSSALMFLTALGSSKAFAHGEDKLGPNGGFIRMPGAFHTEVVPTADREFSVFLLDLSNGNPVTDGSTVSVSLRKGGASVDVTCTPAAASFKCVLPADASLKSGQLLVRASRLGLPSSPALYPLPLKLEQGAH